MEKRQSLRYGAKEADIPGLDELPEMTCTRDELFAYYHDVRILLLYIYVILRSFD